MKYKQIGTSHQIIKMFLIYTADLKAGVGKTQRLYVLRDTCFEDVLSSKRFDVYIVEMKFNIYISTLEL